MPSVPTAARLPNFYPRPPRGGRRFFDTPDDTVFTISIHALREEGDQGGRCSLPVRSVFLSTPSARRATSEKKSPPLEISISIHALREEGDVNVLDFCSYAERFLSTPSARRATTDRTG